MILVESNHPCLWVGHHNVELGHLIAKQGMEHLLTHALHQVLAHPVPQHVLQHIEHQLHRRHAQ
jgi:hypothetical protein